MDKIHTLNDVVTRLCQHTGCSEQEAIKFVNTLTDELTQRLKTQEGEQTIPGLGAFKLDRERFVTFEPTIELAEVINEPFALFEKVMLEPGVTAEELAGLDKETLNLKPEIKPKEEPLQKPEEMEEIHDVTKPMETPLPQPSVKPEEEQIDKLDSKVETEPAVIPVIAKEPEVIPEPETEFEPTPKPTETPVKTETIPNYNYTTEDEIDEISGGHSFNPIIAYILGIVTGFLLCCVTVYFLYPKLMKSSIDEAYGVTDEYEEYDEMPKETPTINDESPNDITQSTPIEQQKAQVSEDVDQKQNNADTTATGVIYDTVGPKYYLAKMAEKYYGVAEFWVYIYEENKGKIKNPNQLPAGLKVVIPPAEKYGIDANDPRSIEKAKNRSHELNLKFQKKR